VGHKEGMRAIFRELVKEQPEKLLLEIGEMVLEQKTGLRFKERNTLILSMDFIHELLTIILALLFVIS
jgi:hypothetical protein